MVGLRYFVRFLFLAFTRLQYDRYVSFDLCYIFCGSTKMGFCFCSNKPGFLILLSLNRFRLRILTVVVVCL
jgi:hypothetical protein